MKPRSFQRAALKAIHAEFERGTQATLLTLATGLGKTICAAHLIPPFTSQGKVMFIAHRDELLDQAEQKIRAVTGQYIDREQGARWANIDGFGEFAPRVICASVQTLFAPMGNNLRVSRFNPMDFSLIILDEVHHYLAKTYRRIVEYFLHGNPNLKLVGLTATPNRKDRKALSQILTTEAFRMDMRAGIDSGWLVMPHVLPLYIAGMDFSRVDASKGELNGKELAQVMEQEAPLQGVAAGMYEKSEGKQTIGFCASVDQAKAITNILNRRDAGVARFVYDKTPDDERRAIARGYRAGDFRILTNVGVYTEGADFPETGCVAMARPTLSTPLYTQMLGRSVRTLTGLLDDIDDTDEQYQLGWDGANTPAAIRKARIAASAKPHALVLDFVGNAGKHDVATAFDALAGDIDPEELAEVKRIARESKGARPVDDVFAEAKRIRREKEEEEERKRRHVVANVQFEMGKMTDVFSAGKDRGMHLGHRDTLATGKQIGFIKGLCKKHGIPRPEFDGMTKREAQKLINRILYSQAPRKSAVTDADYWFYT